MSQIEKYQRKVSSVERIFTRSPCAIVTMVARIKGNLTITMLKDAAKKAQKRHPNLRTRIQEDNNHALYFTSENIQDIPIEAMPRESDDHWIKICTQQSTIPFEFEKQPAIRLFLVQSPQISELIILCHHLICDGLSLAYLARDIMSYLGDPNSKVEELSDFTTIDKDNLPKEATINPLAKFFINNINKKWQKNPTYFDQTDYLTLNQAYWTHFKHKMLTVELSEAQTTSLVERCRKENVTVNTAITSAFLAAQCDILGNKANPKIMVAASVRDRLPKPAKEAVGFYASGVVMENHCDKKTSFWENSRELHRKLASLYTNRILFKRIMNWIYLDPTIMESINFKMIGTLVPPDSPRYNKLSSFSKQKDVVTSLLKRQDMDLEESMWGTAVTNLTRLDFPRKFGQLELDRLIMNPGGMFSLAMVNLVIGVVTCVGKLSLLIEHEENTIASTVAEKIKEKALKFLLET